MKNINKKTIPLSFKPILWSYNFNKLNFQKDRKIIIIQAINYGDLSHWRWLIHNYGIKEIRAVLSQAPITEIKPRARKLASIIFNIKNFNYAPRGIKQTR